MKNAMALAMGLFATLGIKATGFFKPASGESTLDGCPTFSRPQMTKNSKEELSPDVWSEIEDIAAAGNYAVRDLASSDKSSPNKFKPS